MVIVMRLFKGGPNVKEMETNRDVEGLINALTDNKYWVREQVVLALGRMGDARAVEPLIQMLNDKEVYVRQSAVEVLGNMGDARAVAALNAHARLDEIIVVAKNVNSGLAYNLVFTEKRMVLLHVIDIAKTDEDWGILSVVLGGPIARNLMLGHQNAQKNRKEAEYSGLTLDEKLKIDKENVAVNYDEIKKIKFGKHSYKLYLSLAHDRWYNTRWFSLSKEDYAELVKVLPTIDLLKDKLEIKT